MKRIFYPKLLHAFAIATVAIFVGACSSSSGDLSFDAIVMMEDGSDEWIFVNSKGETLNKEEYKTAPSPIINNVFTLLEDGSYTVYTLDGNKPKVLNKLEDLKEAGIMNNNGLMAIVHKNERIKFIDKSGNEQFELGPIDGKEIIWSATLFSNNLLLVKNEDGLFGFVDEKGKSVIAPKFDGVNQSFSDVSDFAAVEKIKDDKTETLIIDKKGETVLKIKEGTSVVAIKGKQIITKKDDKLRIIDTKGETIASLPNKIKYVYQYTDNYIIYNNDDWKKGVYDVKKGEDVIRAKYDDISIMDDVFVCVKEENKGIDFINKSGDITKSFDEEVATYLSGFGLLMGDRDELAVCDSKGEPLSKLRFSNLTFEMSTTINSYYFNAESVATEAVQMLLGADGLAKEGIKLGGTPQSIPAIAKEGADNVYSSTYNLSTITRRQYSISPSLSFTADMAQSKYTTKYESYWGYTYSYQSYDGREFNSNAKLEMIALEIDIFERDNVKPTAEAIIQKLGALDDYKEVASKNNNALFNSSKQDENKAILVQTDDSEVTVSLWDTGVASVDMLKSYVDVSL